MSVNLCDIIIMYVLLMFSHSELVEGKETVPRYCLQRSGIGE